MRLTDALEITNKWPIVLKSALLAKYQSVSATLFSTVMVFHIVVSLLISSAFNSLHRYKKVFRDMQKFVSQSSGVKVVPTMWSHHTLLLSLTHTALVGMNRLTAQQQSNKESITHCLDCSSLNFLCLITLFILRTDSLIFCFRF